MGRIKLDVYVDAPPARVFEVFADLEKAPERVTGIQKLELLTDGPVGEGTRWRETRVMFGKEATEEMWYSVFEPPTRYAVQADTCGSDFVTTFTFEPNGDGTSVAMETVAKARTLGAKLMSPLGFLMSGAMKKLMRKDIEDLKAVAEGDQDAD